MHQTAALLLTGQPLTSYRFYESVRDLCCRAEWKGDMPVADQRVRKSLSDIQVSMKEQRVEKGYATVVDLVFCIDGTGSMQNALDAVKARALTMYKDIIAGLAAKGRMVSRIRVKVVVFRDLFVDAQPYEESDFFVLTGEEGDDAVAFRDYVSGIRAMGGGDGPEHALEALHRIFKMDFTHSGQGVKARHIIVMMTDASAHHLVADPEELLPEERDVYPTDMPGDLTALQEEWELMDLAARRLIIFAPNAYPWNTLGTWEEATHTPSQAGKGISEAVFDEVISAITGSVVI